jgi:flagellar transcriptional activator FlhD
MHRLFGIQETCAFPETGVTVNNTYDRVPKALKEITMLTEERLMSEIRDANLSYLILAQRLIRADKAQALYRLGISEEVASIIEALTPSQMIKVASGNTLMCRFRFDEEMIWSLLTDSGSRGADREEGSASRLHASILMAGKFSEAV